MCQSREHQNVRCAPNSVRCPDWLAGEQTALENSPGHRGYNLPDRPVCTSHRTARCGNHTPSQRSSTQSAQDTSLWPMVAPDYPVCEVINSRLCHGRKAIVYHAVSGMHRTVWCTRGQKATRALQMELQLLLDPLGLKRTP